MAKLIKTKLIHHKYSYQNNLTHSYPAAVLQAFLTTNSFHTYYLGSACNIDK